MFLLRTVLSRHRRFVGYRTDEKVLRKATHRALRTVHPGPRVLSVPYDHLLILS